jgi:predicted phosphohydrolase
MMEPIRLGVMSDLHIEFEPDYWQRIERSARRGDSSMAAEALRRRAELREEPGHPPEGPDLRGLKGNHVDLLLLAGDIHVGVGAIAYADAAAEYLGCPAYMCAGNHDGYSSDLSSLIPGLRDAAARTSGRVSFLEKDRVDLAVWGRRLAILGATLWTDYNVNGDEHAAMIAARQALNDHRLIRYGRSRFAPVHARAIHHDTRAWLGREVVRARDGSDVVVIMTHHAPIPDANPPQYRGGELAPAFVSDLRQEILDWQPDVWVWGHTHFSMRDRLGRTELVSAQRGYIGSEEGAERFVPTVAEV